MTSENEVPQKDSQAKRKLLFVGYLLILLGLFLIGFLPKYFLEKKIHNRAQKDPVMSVSVQIAKSIDVPIELTLPGSTESLHITPLWARVDGYVKDFLVDIGDSVKKGQLLAVIETPELNQLYKQAIGELKSLEAKRDIAKISMERWIALYNKDQKTLAQQDVDDRIASFISAEADVQAALANVIHYKEQMDFKYVIAPFDGIITQRDIDIGTLVTQGSLTTIQKLFTIDSYDTIRIFVNVPQYFFRTIQNGIEAKIRIKEFPNKDFTAFVARYAKALDPLSRTLLTELHLDNKEKLLYPGLFTEASFLLNPNRPYFVVPTSSVIIRSGPPQIAIVDKDNIVHIKAVQIGLDEGNSMQIIDGVAEGDQIVLNPTDRIIDGIKVSIIPQQKDIL